MRGQMLEITVCKYDHTKPRTKQLDESIRNVFRESECDMYGWENTSQKEFDVEEWEERALFDIRSGQICEKAKRLVHPFKLLYEEGVRTGKYLFFLERDNVSKELDFLQADKKLITVYRDVLTGEKTFADLKYLVKNDVLKLAEKNINVRDTKIAKQIKHFEQKLEDFFANYDIKLPEKKKYLMFIGADHNFEKIAHGWFEGNANYDFNVFIPEVEDQEELSIKILTSRLFRYNKGEFVAARFYSGLPFMDSFFREIFRKYFKGELEQLDKIKGKKIDFQYFDEILNKVDFNKLETINEVVEEQAERVLELGQIVARLNSKKD